MSVERYVDALLPSSWRICSVADGHFPGFRFLLGKSICFVSLGRCGQCDHMVKEYHMKDGEIALGYDRSLGVVLSCS